MFTPEQRDYVRNWVLDLARGDARITGGAITGSLARDAEDRWSDVDLAFGVAEGATPEGVLADWTEALGREFSVLHHWDLRSGSWIYRVFLLPGGLQVDIAVAPQADFGARGPTFRPVFGTHQEIAPFPRPDAQYQIGLGWLYVLHAQKCIERGQLWGADHWVCGIRDQVITLASLRLGEATSEARGAHRLPTSITMPLEGALVRSLDEGELRRALGVATGCFIGEVEALDAGLGGGLRGVLEEVGGVQRQDG